MIKSGTKAPRWLWLALTWAGLGLGAAGAVLPVLPTTPFLLFALWAGSRASPRLRFRLFRHPRYGPALRAWHRHRAIPLKAKWLAFALMASSGAVLWLTGASPLVLTFVLTLFAAVSVFILTRPSQVDEQPDTRPC